MSKIEDRSLSSIKKTRCKQVVTLCNKQIEDSALSSIKKPMCKQLVTANSQYVCMLPEI